MTVQTAAPPTSHRRQPARATPLRTSARADWLRTTSRRNATAMPSYDANPTNAAPGFFPALTHFTDSIAALPKEVVRHLSMLKEVEAKLHAPQEELADIVDKIMAHPFPELADSEQDQQAEAARRFLIYPFMVGLNATSMILDEKNAVLLSANQTLSRQLARMESSYAHLDDEFSEEARYGSAKHWAYVNKEVKKASNSNERTRRDLAGANNLAVAAAVVHEGDVAASRQD
jgi:hypothetical protein